MTSRSSLRACVRGQKDAARCLLSDGAYVALLLMRAQQLLWVHGEHISKIHERLPAGQFGRSLCCSESKAECGSSTRSVMWLRRCLTADPMPWCIVG